MKLSSVYIYNSDALILSNALGLKNPIGNETPHTPLSTLALILHQRSRIVQYPNLPVLVVYIYEKKNVIII